MALKTRVRTAGRIVLLSGGLVATYLLFALLSMRLALKTREVQVPDLTNRTANEAMATAADNGLSLKVDAVRRTDSKMAVGQVLAQEPAPGTVTRRQRSIRVWLSAGRQVATAPALLGETERTAELRLVQAGLPISGLSEIRSPDYATDVIVAQEPPARADAAQVALLVNRGDRGATYVMPDLIGFNGERAADLLRSHGFRVVIAASNPYPGLAAGVVTRQNPQSGFQVSPSEPISIEVSR